MPITGDITPQLVRDAALRAGVLLDDGDWYEPPACGRPACACPLVVLILAEYPDFDLAARLSKPFFPRHAAELLGISEARADGFIGGFDGAGRCYSVGYDAEYDRGFGEGAACRAELIPDPGPLLAEVY
jgi:hypothetical protein